MVDEERAASRGGRIAGLRAARDAFYRGDLAQAMVRYHAEHGGWLTARDLADTVPRSSARCRRVSRRRGAPCGPWCQGPVLLQMLPARRRRSRRARAQHPGLCPPRGRGHEALLRRSRALLRRPALRARTDGCAARTGVHRRAPAPRAAGDGVARDAAGRRRSGIRPAGRSASRPPSLSALAEASPALPGDTSYVCVVDRHGNAFSATPSDVSWESPVIPGLGFCPSARGSQSWAVPGHPSCVAPGKRPRLTRIRRWP